jgi:hypothetical protein
MDRQTTFWFLSWCFLGVEKLISQKQQLQHLEVFFTTKSWKFMGKFPEDFGKVKKVVVVVVE